MTHSSPLENRLTSSSSAWRRAAGILVASLIGLSSVASVAAKDLSLPYRNYPGFTCNRWNAQGECSDFSYYDNATSGNYYNGSNYYGSTYPYYGSVVPTTGYYPYGGCTGGLYGCAQGITVRVTGAPSTVFQNDLLTYSIYIRNDDGGDRTIDVRAFVDPQTIFHSASENGRSLSLNEVQWTRLFVRRNSSKTLSLTVRVQNYGNYGYDGYNGNYGNSDTSCYDRYGRYNASYCNYNVGNSYNYNSGYYNTSNSVIRLRVDSGGATDTAVTTIRTGSRNTYGNCYNSYGRYTASLCNNYNNNYNNNGNCYDSYGRYNSSYCRNSYNNNFSNTYGNCYDRYGQYNQSYCY